MPAGLALATRRQPLELTVAPEQTYNEVTFRIPPELQVRELPADRAESTSFGAFAIRFRQDGPHVIYTREVTIHQPELPVELLPAARAWYEALLETDRALLVLERPEQG